ncbi:MAG TPA: response regulator [Methanoregulaceae archaeon]|nr:response regulator [Methanoregulaceae archaeon]
MAMSGDRILLLLIEDNPADLRLVAELLEDAAPGRFRVEPARRLSDGLEALRTGLFAVVLLDLSLPDAEGAAAIGAVREAAPSTPVIVLSGMLDGEVRRSAAEHGAAASFVKGEDSIAPLVAVIDELIRERP